MPHPVDKCAQCDRAFYMHCPCNDRGNHPCTELHKVCPLFVKKGHGEGV